MSRVRVKICGITNLADGLLAAELGADAVGFVFHRPSPRYIAPARAREIARALPAMVSKVGVFAGASAGDAAAIGESAGMDCLQLHARPDGDRPAAWSGRLLPVFSPSAGVEDEDLATRLVDAIRRSGARCFLFDNASPNGAGGTGNTVDWNVARAAGRAGKMVLAGGLTPANVAAAIAVTGPYGVDVASGVERIPGRKDPALMEAFFAAVARAGESPR